MVLVKVTWMGEEVFELEVKKSDTVKTLRKLILAEVRKKKNYAYATPKHLRLIGAGTELRDATALWQYKHVEQGLFAFAVSLVVRPADAFLPNDEGDDGENEANRGSNNEDPEEQAETTTKETKLKEEAPQKLDGELLPPGTGLVPETILETSWDSASGSVVCPCKTEIPLLPITDDIPDWMVSSRWYWSWHVSEPVLKALEQVKQKESVEMHFTLNGAEGQVQTKERYLLLQHRPTTKTNQSSWAALEEAVMSKATKDRVVITVNHSMLANGGYFTIGVAAENSGCKICDKTNESEQLLICDECDECYHTFCLDPPLTAIPEGDWYCPECYNDGKHVKNVGKLTKRKQMKPAAHTTKKWGGGKSCAAQTKKCTIVDQQHFGPIPGIRVGTCWSSRQECGESGIHRPPVGGIAGRQDLGSPSIVLSGGYEDDIDEGIQFAYTGSGGRDLTGNKRTAEQSCDQKLASFNLALARNCFAFSHSCKKKNPAGHACTQCLSNWRKGLPLRVVRGFEKKKRSKPSPYAPTKEQGYRYDGIYKVMDYWFETGQSGFQVIRYFMKRDDEEPCPWLEDEANAKKKNKKKEKEGAEAGKDESEIPEWWWNDLEVIRELIALDEHNRKKWQEICEAFFGPDKNKGQFLEQVQKEFECAICQDVVRNPMTSTCCNNNFCASCLKRGETKSNKSSMSCPMCRAQQKQLVLNSALWDVLVFLFPHFLQSSSSTPSKRGKKQAKEHKFPEVVERWRVEQEKREEERLERLKEEDEAFVKEEYLQRIAKWDRLVKKRQVKSSDKTEEEEEEEEEPEGTKKKTNNKKQGKVGSSSGTTTKKRTSVTRKKQSIKEEVKEEEEENEEDRLEEDEGSGFSDDEDFMLQEKTNKKRKQATRRKTTISSTTTTTKRRRKMDPTKEDDIIVD